MAAAILLSLLGFGLWLLIDLPPLVRSFTGRILASLLGSALLAVAYFRVEPLGVSLNLPPGVRLVGWILNGLGIGLILFSMFIEIPLHLRAIAGLRPIPGNPGAVPVTLRAMPLTSLPMVSPTPAAQNEPVLVTGGTYALCRHPGVLWLAFLLAGGVLRANHSGLIWLGLFWLGVDVLHVTLQDHVIFPTRFGGYRAYQHRTPFLIPTRGSFRRSIGR